MHCTTALRGLLAAGTVAAAMAATTPAHAAQVERVEHDGATWLVFQATPGVADKLEVFHTQDGIVLSTFMSEGGHQSSSCVVPAGNRPHELLCSADGVDAVYVEAGDGDDEVNASHASNTLRLPIVVAGGAGDDRLTGGAADDALGGEAGNDRLTDSGGSDALDGGEGSDHLFSSLTSAGDQLQGGAGRDTAGFQRDEPFTVALDGQANDGVAGEGDDVQGVEDLEVQNGGATFVGDDGPNRLVSTFGAGTNRFEGRGGDDELHGGTGNDTLVGGDGNDSLTGEDGDDVLDGGAGKDAFIADRRNFTYLAGVGDDTILARDGVAETLNCGPGADRAVVDGTDLVPNDPVTVCEAVERGDAPASPGTPGAGAPGTPGTGTPAAPGSPGATPGSGLRVTTLGAVRLRPALRSGLRVGVTVPGAGRVTVEARRGRTVVARGSATATAAGTATVRLRFTKAAAARLRRVRSVSLTVTATAGGARASRTVRLR